MGIIHVDHPPIQTDLPDEFIGRLGRIKSVEDPRFRPMSAVLQAEDWMTAPLPKSKHWPTTFDILDQGQTSSCVGQTGIELLMAYPVPFKYNRLPFDGYQLYSTCQDNDEWPGREPSYYGTSIHALMRVLYEKGLITEYRWANSLEVMQRWVAFKGPVAIGVDWHRDMFKTDQHGFVKAEGPVYGGHAVLVTGADFSRRTAFRFPNSWGRDWGDNGRAWLSFSDFERRLLPNGGDVAAPTEFRKPRG